MNNLRDPLGCLLNFGQADFRHELVARLLIDQVFKRLPGYEPAKVINEALHGEIKPIGGDRPVGAMRGDQDIAHTPERRIRSERLVLEYIERSACDPLLLQCANESRLVNHGSAPNVDYDGGWFHRLKFGIGEHMM